MSRIRGKDTRPELLVRRLIHSLGYRYRLHLKDLPGRPDLVFGKRRAVIMVHGCFWHGHRDPACKLARLPKTRLEFWVPKIEATRVRDERNRQDLAKLGWRVLELWECQLADRERLVETIKGHLGEP